MRHLFVFLALPLLLLAAVASAQDHHRPVVGINTGISQRESGVSVGFSYIDAVESAGGIPVLLPPVLSKEAVAQYCGMVDAFVFIGGPDIDPKRYGQEPHETHNPIPARREEFDFMLMAAALETKKPVLAVCLGMQELTVQGGGTMIQDIPSQTESEIDHRPGNIGKIAHEVEVVPGTKLHEILGATKLEVNSAHHQACAGTGEGMTVSARAPDGMVEAVEIPGHPFALGVQWHPEALAPEHEVHAKIFAGLIAEAKKQMGAAKRP